VLTPFDDYPLHQTSQPIAHPGTDANHYDRYFFNGYTADGSLYFGAALGVYPNRSVIDGAFSVVRGGEQVNVYASGLCPIDRTHTAVGPLRVEVVEPLRVLDVTVDAPAHGLRAELRFRKRTEVVEEPHFLWRRGTQTIFDYTRLTQFGTWEGWIEVDGERVECSPNEVVGSRDRSWGVRPVGQQPPGPPAMTQFYWLWAPVNFDDVCTHFDVNEHGDGRRWHETGFVVPVGDGPPEEATAIDYRAEWLPGTRHVRTFEIDLTTRSGSLQTVRLEPFLHFQMAGLGYTHPDWRHGHWKGELAVAGDRWSLPVADPLALQHLHIQALCRATMGDRTGVGILEQLVIGLHEPTGLREWTDGAPA
jgi:hypothetical protein